jgi:hypothetical protein
MVTFCMMKAMCESSWIRENMLDRQTFTDSYRLTGAHQFFSRNFEDFENNLVSINKLLFINIRIPSLLYY